MTGDKINVHGKVYLNIAFGGSTYHHVAYVADINDQFILVPIGFPESENNFKIDFENNALKFRRHSCIQDDM